MNRQNLTNIHIIIDKIVKRHFSQICNRITALGWCQDLWLLSTLRMNGHNSIKFCIHIIIDKIYVVIVMRHLKNARVTAIFDVRIWFLLNILRMDGQNFALSLNVSLSSDGAMAGLYDKIL